MIHRSMGAWQEMMVGEDIGKIREALASRLQHSAMNAACFLSKVEKLLG